MFLTGKSGIAANSDWQYEMGWRYVKYQDQRGVLIFSIDPMVKGSDVVNIPSEEIWSNTAPAWASKSAKEVLDRLKSVTWHRNLNWVETENAKFIQADKLPIPGSLESTPGGKKLESYRLFHPASQLTHDQAHEIWHTAARRFAESAHGQVTIFANQVNPNSVFGAIEVPTLKTNPNVTLVWH